MPELPDVEALRRYLIGQELIGRTIAAVTILWPKAVQSGSVETFVAGVTGRRIKSIGRRAKFLLVRLNGEGVGTSPRRRPKGAPKGRTLLVHLRMTGWLLVEPAHQERPRNTRNVFHLDDGRELRFVDPRKLGMLWLVQDESEVLSSLGPEPLDTGFTPGVLAERLARHNAPVKAVLCDQAVVAGIGNIYADEMLFVAGVHPLRRAAALTAAQVEWLHSAIGAVLPQAAERLARLMPLDGPPTEMEEGLARLLVPRRAGAPCSRCHGPVERLAVRGRSAYFCPRCQPR